MDKLHKLKHAQVSIKIMEKSLTCLPCHIYKILMKSTIVPEVMKFITGNLNLEKHIATPDPYEHTLRLNTSKSISLDYSSLFYQAIY